MSCGTTDILRLQRTLEANTGYRAARSVAQARLLADTIRQILSLPQRTQFGGVDGEQMTYDTQTLYQMAREADQWADMVEQAGVAKKTLPGFRYLRV